MTTDDIYDNSYALIIGIDTYSKDGIFEKTVMNYSLNMKRIGGDTILLGVPYYLGESIIEHYIYLDEIKNRQICIYDAKIYDSNEKYVDFKEPCVEF